MTNNNNTNRSSEDDAVGLYPLSLPAASATVTEEEPVTNFNRMESTADLIINERDDDSPINFHGRRRRFTFLSLLNHITVEPTLFFYTFAYMMYAPVYSYMFMNKLCLQYCGFTQEQCSNYGIGTNPPDVDITVEKTWAKFDNYNTIISTVPSVLFALFIGPWSDAFGRKPPMLFPFVGLMLGAACALVLYYVPNLPLIMILLPTLLQSVFGGMTTLLTGAFSYAADMAARSTTRDTRTIRIAVVDMFLAAGFGIGGLVSGLMLQGGVKYDVCYAAAFVASLVGFLYVLIRIRETRQASSQHTAAHKFLNLFSTRNLSASIRTMLQKRPGHVRLILWLLIITMFFHMSIFMSDEQMNQKYLTGAPLHWSFSFYMKFSSIWTFINMAAVGACIVIAKRVLKLRDVSIGIVGCLSRIGYAYVLGIATNTWMVALAYAVGIVKFMAAVSIRTLMSRMVAKDEQGRVFALLATFEACSPLAGSVFVTAVFNATAAWWTGFFSVVTAYVSLIPLILLAIVDIFITLDETAGVKHF